jgi:thermitase
MNEKNLRISLLPYYSLLFTNPIRVLPFFAVKKPSSNFSKSFPLSPNPFERILCLITPNSEFLSAMSAAARSIRCLLGLALLLLGLGMPARPAAAQTVTTMGQPLPDVVLVKVSPSASADSLASCLHSANSSRQRDIAAIHVLRLKTPPGEADQALARLKACPGILYAERDYPVYADLIPGDPSYPSQWGFTNIRAPQAWDLATGSAAVTIAILDTGIDLDHPDLAAKIVPGYDFVNNDANPQDDTLGGLVQGHGTHVAGIAAAITDNSVGVAGVSWGARLMPVKVLNASGNGTFSDVATGIIWAADHGAQVINMSFGGTTSIFPQTLQDAVNYAFGKGAVLVAAAGNDAKSESIFPFYPAILDNVIDVTATDQANVKASFANYGPHVDLAAPGVGIYSTMLDNTYASETGTSMATPFVSGLAALLSGLLGSPSPPQVIQALESTALDLGPAGRDNDYGFGLIQADAAIQFLSHRLTVNKIGSGTVTSSPTGLDCGHTCAANVVTGTVVTLTAQPFLGATFLGWSDPACPGTDPCTLTLTANTSITAEFTYSLVFPIIFK